MVILMGMVVSMATLSSCSKDDEDEFDITGTWVYTDTPVNGMYAKKTYIFMPGGLYTYEKSDFFEKKQLSSHKISSTYTYTPIGMTGTLILNGGTMTSKNLMTDGSVKESKSNWGTGKYTVVFLSVNMIKIGDITYTRTM